MASSRCAVLVILAALAGCEVLAPVVGVRDAPPEPECHSRTTCDSIPPLMLREPVLLSDLDLPDIPCTAATTRHIEASEDTALVLDDAACVEVSVPVSTSGAPVALTVAGPAVENVRLTVDADVPCTLSIAPDVIARLDLRLFGEIAASMAAGQVTSTRVTLTDDRSRRPPELVVGSGQWTDVAILAPGSHVWIRRSVLADSFVEADTLTVERSTMLDGRITASTVELLDVDIGAQHLDVGHLAGVRARFAHSRIARCDEVWIASGLLDASEVAACTGALDIASTMVSDAVVRGRLVGRSSTVNDSLVEGDVDVYDVDFSRAVLRGARVHDDSGSLGSVALCGTVELLAGSLSCPTCEPEAPPDVCVEAALEPTELCPGLCDTQCDGAPNECGVAHPLGGTDASMAGR